MPDSPCPPQDTRPEPTLIETRVCIDDILGPFDATLDPHDRWNGWLSPYFTLDTVRQLAARTQEMAEKYGPDSADTIHVVDGGTTSDGDPRVVVLHISWQHMDDGPASAATVIEPTGQGLYGIGAWQWTWHYATWLCPCGERTNWHKTRCDTCGTSRDAAEAEPTS